MIYEYENFTRCCDIPPKVECCDCPNGISSIWEIQNDLSGMYSEEVGEGIRQVWGCEKLDHPLVKRVSHTSGPSWSPPTYPTGTCFWQSEEAQPGRCCDGGCVDGPPDTGFHYLSAYMGCFIVEEVPPTEAQYAWFLDCGCDDLWCGDSSEWGTIEDCLEYDTNCRCCNDDGLLLNTEEECNLYRDYFVGLGFECAECEQVETQPATPGHPRYVSHMAGLSGACACTINYVHLNELDIRCKNMLDSIDPSQITPFNCDGCNTYLLWQYIGTDGEGNEVPESYPCGLGVTHICNGSDLGCSTCCEGGIFTGYRMCKGYPATLTICPAESIVPPSSDSEPCNPDVLCCEELEALSVQNIQTQPQPENSLYFSLLNTSTDGYLIKEADGIYRGGVSPIRLEVDIEKKTLNGREITVYSDEPFMGRGRIGDNNYGFYVELMA